MGDSGLSAVGALAELERGGRVDADGPVALAASIPKARSQPS